MFHIFTRFATIQIDAITKPKKNAHTNVGYWCSKYDKNFAKRSTAVKMPAKRGRRNRKGIDAMASLILNLSNSLGVSPLSTFLILKRRVSYTPEIKATVPPDTPGMRSAVPMKKPVIYRRNIEKGDFDFIVYTITNIKYQITSYK